MPLSLDDITAAKARVAEREEQARKAQEAEEIQRLQAQCAELERTLTALFGAEVLTRLGASVELRQVVRLGHSVIDWPAAVFEVEGVTLVVTEAYYQELFVARSKNGRYFSPMRSIGKVSEVQRISREQRWDGLLLAIGTALEWAGDEDEAEAE